MPKSLTVVVALALVLMAAPAAQAQTPYGSPPTASQAGRPMVDPAMTRAQKVAFWRTVRKIAKCALGIAVFVGSNVVAVSKLRKAGGVWKVAKRTWRAKGKIRKVAVLTSVFGEVLGLNQVAEGCGA